MLRGLTVSVYKDAQWVKDGVDCTNSGVTSHEDRLLLVGPGVDGPEQVPEHVSTFDGYYIVELDPRMGTGFGPRVIPKNRKLRDWFMFGGNFVFSSDSRFSALNNGFPIPVHDRVEA